MEMSCKFIITLLASLLHRPAMLKISLLNDYNPSNGNYLQQSKTQFGIAVEQLQEFVQCSAMLNLLKNSDSICKPYLENQLY
ncbi:hypothetical protein T01_1844 [Trichinella spiralis]|uniref:Uncharacterized protein n=1 Tax=Trichinella spiralis TaxID=6334 RepID=A0A0V1BKC8_TRISP|nr:hypothetical protein T01_1844 [Trichinella spiralis]